MDDPGNLFLKLLLLLVLILVNAFFAMSEIAVISLNDAKIDKMAEEGHKKAKKVVKLTENSAAFLSTIQIGVTLAGFLTSASASQTFVEKFGATLVSWFGAFGQSHAGFLNGLCYLGNAVSSFALGLIADEQNWTLIFVVFAVGSFIAVLCYPIYVAVVKKNPKRTL